MKKFVTLVLIMALVWTLIGCQIDGESDANQTEILSETERITLSAEEKFPGVGDGIPLEECEHIIWKVADNALILSGEGPVISYAMSYFPWKTVDYQIETLIISSGITYASQYAFHGMENLQRVVVEDGALRSTDMGCFSMNKKLVYVDFGNTLEEIASESFSSCAALEEVHVPKTVTKISWRAFEGCTALQTIYYSGTAEDWNDIIIESGNEALANAQIIYKNE